MSNFLCELNLQHWKVPPWQCTESDNKGRPRFGCQAKFFSSRHHAGTAWCSTLVEGIKELIWPAESFLKF